MSFAAAVDSKNSSYQRLKHSSTVGIELKSDRGGLSNWPVA